MRPGPGKFELFRRLKHHFDGVAETISHAELVHAARAGDAGALGGLPQDQLVTIMLRYFGRHASYQEIAATFGIPVGTVRGRLSQAKTSLTGHLLRTASATHQYHDKLIAQRRQEWDAIVHEVCTTGSAALYVADCAHDALVEAPSMAYREVGPEAQRRGVEDTAAAGVRAEMTDVVASNTVTIWEAAYRNPAHDPHHCPPTHTEVRFHPAGRTTKIALYYPSWEASST